MKKKVKKKNATKKKTKNLRKEITNVVGKASAGFTTDYFADLGITSVVTPTTRIQITSRGSFKSKKR